MDAKEKRNKLKLAREAINKKEFREAMQHCQAIIKHDKENYNAWVFVGVSAQGMDQHEPVLEAFRKAIKINPVLPLAWQGLVGFLEESGHTSEEKNELIDAYRKLSPLLIEDSHKQFQVQLKLAKLLAYMNQLDKAVDVWDKMLHDFEDDRGKSFAIWNSIATILSQRQESLTEHQKSLLQWTYGILLQQSDLQATSENEEHFVNYIKILEKAGKVKEVKIQSERMRELFPSNAFPLEKLCGLWLEKAIDNPIQLETVNMNSELKRLSKCGIACITHGASCLQNRDYVAAKQQLLEGLQYEPNNAIGWLFLARCQLKMSEMDDALESSMRGLKYMPRLREEVRERLQPELQLCKARSLVQIGNKTSLRSAIEIFAENRGMICDGVNIEMAYMHIDLEEFEEARKILNDLKLSVAVEMCSIWLSLHANDTPPAELLLNVRKLVVGGTEASSWQHYVTGRLRWSLAEERSACNADFVAAAKCNPYFPDAFLYIGHYFREVCRDDCQAARCYEQAFRLNPHSTEIGQALSDAYRRSDQQTANLSLLLSVTGKAVTGEAKWAWLRLGLIFMQKEDHAQAITSLQRALRADPADAHCWECLGEAYLKRGSYTTAHKSFTKAAQLQSSTAVYSLYQMANIKQLLGCYTEAVEQYRKILKSQSGYIPAMKGAAESLLAQSKHARNDFLPARAVARAQQALDLLAAAAALKPRLSCLWALLGNACSALDGIPEPHTRMTVPTFLLQINSENQTKELSKEETLECGSRCFLRALSLQPDCFSLWHDLALTYYMRWQAGSKQETGMLDKAMEACYKALSLHVGNHKFWTSFGVFAFARRCLALAQHSFLRSLMLQNNAEAWTCLAVLYLTERCQEPTLASTALGLAQQLAPDAIQPWVGMASVAKAMASSQADRWESMDLYRHSTDLGNHMEGFLGYANWVCRAILSPSAEKSKAAFKLNVEDLYAIPAAADFITKYIACCSKPPVPALNMLGLLLLQLDQPAVAARVLQRALGEARVTKHENVVRKNLIAALCSCKEWAGALQQLNTLPAAQSDLTVVCLRGFANYKLGQLKDSYHSYELALTMTKADNDRNYISIAMAMVAYAAKDVSGAKTLLFECGQSEPASSSVRLLCALALLEGDMTLAAAALEELAGCAQDDASYYCRLLGYFAAKQDSDGLGRLMHYIHQNPTSSSAWMSLSELLLRKSNDGQAKCGRDCIENGLRVGNQGNPKKHLVLLVLNLLAAGHIKKAFRMAQKALFMYPTESDFLHILTVAWFGHAVTSRQRCKFFSLVPFVHHCLLKSSKSNVLYWRQFNIIAQRYAEMHSEKRPNCLLSNICGKWEGGKDFCNEVHSKLIGSKGQHQTYHEWAYLYLAKQYERIGEIGSVEKCFTDCQRKFFPLIWWQFLALRISKNCDDESIDWITVYEKTKKMGIAPFYCSSTAFTYMSAISCMLPNSTTRRFLKSRLKAVVNSGDPLCGSLLRKAQLQLNTIQQKKN